MSRRTVARAVCHPDMPLHAKSLCHNCYEKKHKQSNPLGLGRTRNKHYLARYKISGLDYQLMLDEQGGACAVCGLPPTTRLLEVEHRHSDGKVRGLVHHTCNGVVGAVEGPLHQQAIDYLERTA